MVSQPKYATAVALDRMVEMRDGTRLATDVYRPASRDSGEPIDEPRPALLLRTPYDKRDRKRIERHGHWYARRGYVVALQDCRGRYASEGEFYLLANEAEDGYDTVEWLADQPYCDRQVGTMGTSYSAWVQNALASLDPPHLEAMFVNQGAANGWKATLRQNGAFELRWLCWALTIGGGFAQRALEDPDVQRRLANVRTDELLAEGPVFPGQSPLRHVPGYEEWLFDYATADGDDELWESPAVNFEAHYEEMADVPTVYAGSWYDSYAKATCDNFAALSEMKESEQYLVMGAWIHGGVDAWSKPYAGEVSFGESGPRAYLELRLRFFDHYLKGEETWSDQSPVEYFGMGTGDGSRVAGDRLFHGGAWYSADEWPLPDAETTTYYAHADGTLRRERPGDEASSTSYRFDPRDPVPTVGGNCSSYITPERRDETIEAYPLENRPFHSITGQGGYDQRTREWTVGAAPPYRPLEERDDVLVFRTAPLTEAVEIAGPIRVTVYGSTDAPDTDFTAKLIDEYPPSEDFPDGVALNLCDSICRARYRGYRRDPDFVEPEEVYEFPVEPYPTANVFKPGHRIRLDISSSNYPRYDVNPNTGGPLYADRDWNVATNTVYHERAHPTGIDLPIRSVGEDN
ncbi:CocE/NonD family hydrolase [Halegenticoccus soli]|uniref:CocE/NonD family hydrolase n=1 Tax=Halegenticoccus soli TaxID=1985678 RepID=UPI000C6CA27B|nr:CocE/NonD family hydrolase [Halegenticoccus soli]